MQTPKSLGGLAGRVSPQAAEGAETQDTPPPMPQEEYRRIAGCRCPFCHTGSIEGASLQSDEGIVSQQCICFDCDAEWTDYYRLAGYARDQGVPGGEDEWDAFLTTTIVETVTRP